MLRFELHRSEDVSGVSGVGVVAEGVAFSNDGPVALRWCSEWPTSVVFHDRGVESLEAVHGHQGRTRIVWLDEITPGSAAGGAVRGGDAGIRAGVLTSETAVGESGSIRVLVPAAVLVAALVAVWLGTGVAAAAVLLYVVGGVMLLAGSSLLVARAIAGLVDDCPTEDQP